MKISTAARASSTDTAPLKMVSSPSVAPIVFSLAGCDLSVAGRAPERRMRTRSSVSLGVKSPVIWPLPPMAELSRGAERTWLSSTTARSR